MDGQITIIKRDTIPPLEMALSQGSVNGARGERRDFRWNEELRRFMPAATELSVSWIRLDPAEVLPSRRLSADSLMIVYAGSGEISGDALRAVSAEDVVLIPSGYAHRFVAGPQGLSALSLLIGEESASSEGADISRLKFAGLVEYARNRAEVFRRRPLFDLLTTDSDPSAHALCLQLLDVWANRCDTLLVVRQAACTDAKYAQVFSREAAAHWESRSLQKHAGREGTFADPILSAFADWFTRQMYVLDNAQKLAVVELVLGPANAELGKVAASCSHWSDRGAISNEVLLRGQTLHDYERLQRIVEEAWDMLDAMSDRLVLLAQSGATSRELSS